MAAHETTKDSSSTCAVKCKKCLKHYDDPRMLPCLHSFCKSCVGQLVIQTGSKKTVRCPTCYSTTPLPLKGVEVFPRNVRLSYEATISKYEAQVKSEPPPSCDECRREPPLETVSFCCTCRGFLCKECRDIHSRSQMLTKHHVVFSLKEIKAKDVSVLLKQHIPPPPITCAQHPEKNVEFFCSNCSILVCVQCALIKHRGHEFEELNDLSKKRRIEIKESILTMPDSIAKLEETLAKGMDTKKELKVSKKAVDDKIHKAFKEMREELDKREKALLAKSSEISTAKETSLTIQLEELTSLKEQMVACTGVVAEVQESYNDTDLLSVVTTLQTRVQKLTQHFDKTPLKLREGSSIELTLDTKGFKNELKEFGSVRDIPPPRDYTTLKAEPLMTISSPTPYFVAVHDSGDILIPSNSGNSINVFDKNGQQKANFGQQRYPKGVAVTGDIVFIVECSNVKKLTMTGELLLTFGKSQLSDAWGCAVSSSGVIYVADASKNRVQAFNPDGTLSCTIGADRQLNFPEDVAIDKHNNIHVASYSSGDIKVFAPNGSLLREYGKDHLKKPSGVAVDDDGYCLVGDQGGNSLVIFDPQGKLVHSIKFPSSVRGVTLDKDGFIYVVESGSSGKVYKY